MNKQITERLKTLQAEYDAGQKMLADLDARRQSLTSTMLRIEGALEVLKDLSQAENPILNGSAAAPLPD